jgi:hypothetical protein
LFVVAPQPLVTPLTTTSIGQGHPLFAEPQPQQNHCFLIHNNYIHRRRRSNKCCPPPPPHQMYLQQPFPVPQQQQQQPFPAPQ